MTNRNSNFGTESSCELLVTEYLLKTYGPYLTVEQYASFFKLKVSTVHKQISDETIAVKPVKFGRNNLFAVSKVADTLHGR